jgi:hypothetical protein
MFVIHSHSFILPFNSYHSIPKLSNKYKAKQRELCLQKKGKYSSSANGVSYGARRADPLLSSPFTLDEACIGMRYVCSVQRSPLLCEATPPRSFNSKSGSSEINKTGIRYSAVFELYRQHSRAIVPKSSEKRGCCFSNFLAMRSSLKNHSPRLDLITGEALRARQVSSK